MRARWRYQKLVASARRARGSGADRVRGVLAGLVALVVLVGAVWASPAVTRVPLPELLNGSQGFGPVFAALLVVLIVALALSSLLGIVDMWVPLREQQRYRKLTGAGPLSPRQQQVLALDAVSDFRAGGWNGSLEYVPAWVRMPAIMQRQHRSDGRYSPFLTLRLVDPFEVREFLDRSMKIASASQVRSRLERMLGEASMSLRLADLLSSSASDDAVRRLAALTGSDEAGIRSLGVAQAGRPARLLWAGDVMYGIGFVRNAFVAGYLSEQDAWQQLERLADVAFACFADAREYWSNTRVAIALSSDDMRAVHDFDTTFEELQRSAWPAASIPFPHAPEVAIPDTVRNLRPHREGAI